MGATSDLRGSAIWREVESILAHGLGVPSDAGDLSASPDGHRIAFTTRIQDALDSPPRTALAIVDVKSGDVHLPATPPNGGRLPAWGPDGHIAFVADEPTPGQPWILATDGTTERLADVDGTVEQLQWSRDGSRLLLRVAGAGAEKSGIEGSGTTVDRGPTPEGWFPDIDDGLGGESWRWVEVLEVDTGRVTGRQRVTPDGVNIWAASWAGDDIVAVTSGRPDEGSWYDAVVSRFDPSGSMRVILDPQDQLGMVSADPAGRRTLVVQSVASDRDVVAGPVALVEADGTVTPLDTAAVDVSHLVWRDADRILISGHRGSATIVGEIDLSTRDRSVHVLWDSLETCGGRVYPQAWPHGSQEAVLVVESAARPPTIAVVGEDTGLRPIVTVPADGATTAMANLAEVRDVTWTAPDGQQVQGWLTRPRGASGPLPTILEVHGGPVFMARNTWIGRQAIALAVLVGGGAHFRPNARGSAGWGQDWVTRVVGDLGGRDADDHLSGLDHLVEAGLADPDRLGVSGVSYGGFMTYALTTADRRFRAAAALFGVCDYYAVRHSCNIPEFVERFLLDDPEDPVGRYRTCSPIHQASAVTTPTMHIVGSRDRCAPPDQGEFMHRALVRHGQADSVLVNYPQEGHGVRGWPAYTDYVARLCTWFSDQGLLAATTGAHETEPISQGART